MTDDALPLIRTSKILYHDVLYEQVYNPTTKKTNYLGWDTKKQDTIPIDYIEDGVYRYIPSNDELLQKGTILLPSAAIPYGTEDDLELEIKSFIKTWLDVSEEHLQKATWYVLLSRLMDKINTLPYLRCLGDYGTGKTRYLDVIGGICYKPLFVGGAVSVAPIYRVIDKWRGTAIFDEFNLKSSDDSEAIIQILNNGYQRGKSVLRCQDGNYENVRAFDPFCPKILATRDRFKDKALESRCVTEILKTTGRTDIPIDLTKSFFEKRQELQNKLLMYRFKNWENINTDEMINVDFGQVLPRIKQVHAPFTVLFLNDKDRLTKFIGYVQDTNRKIIEENSMSFDGQIINTYVNLLDAHEKQVSLDSDYTPPVITSGNIKDHMVEFEGWNAEKLNTRTIGRHIRTLGFEVTPKFIAGKTQKIITIDDDAINNLKLKYVITSITSITSHYDEAHNNNIGDECD